MDSVLDPRLDADTLAIADWPLCRVRLMNDARYPWLILIPRRVGCAEILDLAIAERQMLMEEIARASETLRIWPGVEKINIGALGNVVNQLHIHALGRSRNDPAWPGPVWGHSRARTYRAGEADDLIAAVLRS